VELHGHYDTIREAGAEVVALAVAPVEAVEGWCQRAGINYPMLADATHQVAEGYGVYNLMGDNLAAPAVFIIDTDGRIVWHRVGQSVSNPVGAQTILEHLP
jgi:peroxiredoxin